MFMCVEEHELGLDSWQVESIHGLTVKLELELMTHSTTAALAVNQHIVPSYLLSLPIYMISVRSIPVSSCY